MSTHQWSEEALVIKDAKEHQTFGYGVSAKFVEVLYDINPIE